jgi:hypothetical protein
MQKTISLLKLFQITLLPFIKRVLCLNESLLPKSAYKVVYKNKADNDSCRYFHSKEFILITKHGI